MKRLISVFVALSMVMTLFTGTVFADPGKGNGHGKNKDFQETKQFKDMTKHWSKESVQKIQSYGLINGYEDGSFQPDKAITQAELAVIIDRLIQIQQNWNGNQAVVRDDDDDDDFDEDDLKDLPVWAKESIKKGAEKKYFNLKRFHSQVQCDRLMATVALAKALGLDPVTDFKKNPFADRGLMSDEDFGYVLALYHAGFIKGFPNGNFNPNTLISRAQLACIIDKIFDDYDDDDDDYSNDKEEPIWPNNSAVTASSITANSVVLNWSAASDNEKVVGYKVIYDVNGTEKEKVVYTGKSVKITDLKSNEEYTFTIEARDAAGNWSDDGPSVEITTSDATVSEQPTWPAGSTITASSITENSVILDWTAAADDVKVVGYKLTYKIDGTEKIKYVSNERTAQVSGLVPDEEYTFTVEAKDADGNWSNHGPSVEINTLESTVDTTGPTWPSGAALTVSPSSTSMVTLVWPDAEDNTAVKGYKVYQDSVLIKTLDADTNDLIVSGLKEKKEYSFKVRAFDAAGNVSTLLSKSFLTE